MASAERKWLKGIVERQPGFVVILARLSPRQALAVMGIHRRLDVNALSVNINRAKGLPFERFVKNELILALKRYSATDRMMVLKLIERDAWRWLGGFGSVIEIYPAFMDAELAGLLREDVAASVKAVSDATDEQPAVFLKLLIKKYCYTRDNRYLDLAYTIMKQLEAGQSAQYKITAQWLLACDAPDVRKVFLEAYLDAYQYDDTVALIESGLAEDRQPDKTLENLAALAVDSEKLRPVIDEVLAGGESRIDDAAAVQKNHQQRAARGLLTDV